MSNTKDWNDYEAAKSYNNQLNYNNIVKTNWKFYEGDQWYNLSTESNLPKPVFNIINRVISYFVASLTSINKTITLQQIDIMASDNNTEDGADVLSIANSTLKNCLEKLRFKKKRNEGLTSAAVTGDFALHFRWDKNKKPYGSGLGMYSNIKGEIECDVLDSRKVFFMNPATPITQNQPAIIVSGNDTVKALKSEAKANKRPSMDIDGITADDESEYKITEDEYAKAEYIIVYKRGEDGKIFASKSTKTCYIYENKDTGLHYLPIAFMNWDKSIDSYHGRSSITKMLPNQIFINRMFAMVMRHLMLSAFPKTIYNGDVIDRWDTEIGKPIKVNVGDNSINVDNVAKNLNPSSMSGDIINCIQLAMQYTKETLGITDAALGNINPENTSAIIAVQKSSAIPLENISTNEDIMYEDVALILLDFFGTYYGKRPVLIEATDPVTQEVTKVVYDFDYSILKELGLNVTVQSGDSSYWSEIVQNQSLDNLLINGKIELVDYLERIPDSIIPMKKELVKKIKNASNQMGLPPPVSGLSEVNQAI